MEMKNKLYHHHKSKFSLVVKKFSLCSLGVFGFIAMIAIPTYISTLSDTSKPLVAENENQEEVVEENVEQNDGNEDLLTYVEE